MRWRKLGRIFEPPAGGSWARSHAMTPFAVPLGGHRFRVYFAARDERNRSQVGYVELDLRRPERILTMSETPVIALGPLGSFDDSGVLASWVVGHAGRLYHYYGGWSLGQSVPFYCFTGLAVSHDGGLSFEKVSPSPILDRSPMDPYMNGSPCVIVEDGRWRMWYYSAVRWTLEEGSPKHYYHICYAESDDGLRWRRDGRVAITFASAAEYAIARPSVIRDGNRYRMWYSYRGPAYRIGYAESPDGYTWTRLDQLAGIDVSAEGWDHDMIEYPHVFRHDDRLYMLYNGDGYGRTGFGLAVLDV